MLNLAWRHVRQHFGQWCAVALVETVVGVLVTWSLGLVIAGAQAGGDVAQAYGSIGGVQLVFVALTGVGCIVVITRMVVAMCRTEIAQWQLAGVLPRRAAVTVLTVVMLCALLGCSVADVVAAVSWPVFSSFVASSGLPTFPGLHTSIPAAGVWSGWGASVLSAFIAGLLTMRSTMRIEPVELVRLHPMRTTRMGKGSSAWLVFWLTCLVAAYWGISRIPHTDSPESLESSMSGYWGCGLLLLLALQAGSPIIFPFTFRQVSRLVPQRRGTAGFTARANVARRGAYTQVMALPLVLGAGILGSLYGMVAQTRDTAQLLGDGNIHVSPWRQMVLLFAGPVIIAIVTGIGTVFATSRQRSLDLERLRALGISTPTMAVSMVLEFMIYMLGTTVLCYVVLWINSILFATALRHGPLPGAHTAWPGPMPALIIAVGCLVSLGSAAALVAGRTLQQTRQQRHLMAS